MKTIYIGMLTVMAMLSLTACNNKEEVPQEPAAEGIPICFQVSTGDMQSRASHTNANTIDKFGLFIKSATEGVTYPNKNLIFTGKVEGNKRIWTPNENVAWQINPHTVDMIAYYPTDLYKSTESPFRFYGIIKIEENQTVSSYKSDVMTARISKFDPSTLTEGHPIVNLQFQHLMSQLQVVITFPKEAAQEKIDGVQTICVGETMRYGMLNAEKNEVTQLENIGIVNAYQSGIEENIVTFKCILIPQTVDKGKLRVSFFYDGNYYDWTSNQNITFNQNTIHTLNLTVNNATAAQTQSMQSRSWGGHTAYEVISNSMN